MSSSGQELARFVRSGQKKDCAIVRVNPAQAFASNSAAQVYGQPMAPAVNQTNVIGTIKTSSLSDKAKMTIHGLNATVESQSLGGIYIFRLPSQTGFPKMSWEAKMNGDWELLDSKRNIVAIGAPTSRRLDVFVSVNELTLDSFLVGWIGVLQHYGYPTSNAEAKQQYEEIEAAANVINAVAGS